MQFQLTDEQTQACESFRGFVEAKVRPLIQPHLEEPAPKEVVRSVFQLIAPFGLGSGWTSEKWGGLELDLVTSGLLYEELSRTTSGLAAAVGVNDTIAMLLEHLGTDDMRKRYLPGLLSGELIASIAVTEPNVGSNPAAITARASRHGASLRLHGEKVWITNGNISDLVVVICNVDGAPSMVLVDREHGYTSRDIKKLGQKEASSAQLFLDDVEVPASNLVGEPGAGLKATMRLFERARCLVGCFATGVAAAALDFAVEYAKNRIQWGKPIGAHQLVQALLAEMATDLECSRLITLKALSLVQAGVRSEDVAAMAKWFASEASIRVATKAVQVHGSYGLSCEFPVERLLRDARMLNIPDGTTQIQKLIIGRKLTGLSAFN
jgi:acyl-CoA dehydrogenase